MHLSEKIVEGLRKSHTSKRVTFSDKAIKGLSLEIRPTGEGSWRYRYSFGGKQECISLGLVSEVTLSNARSLVLQLLDRIEQGDNPVSKIRIERERSAHCDRFEDFVNAYYIPHIRSYKRSFACDLTLLANHLIPSFGDKIMNQIERVDVLRFQQEKQEAGYKPAYCNRILVLLGFCFNLAIKWEVHNVSKNPVKLVPFLHANNKKERFLTPDESIKLLKTIDQSPNPLLKYFVSLALLTGMRKREILDARWESIDWERRLWTVPLSKSGYARHIPLNPETMNVLYALRSKLPDLLAQKGFVDNPWIIPNWRTGKPFQSIFNSWNTARKAAALDELRIHDLRHSFASALVNKGIPIYDVQKLLGHQDVKTTERYSHFSIDRLRQSALAVSDFYDLKPN